MTNFSRQIQQKCVNTTISDVMSSSRDDIHRQLYVRALSAFLAKTPIDTIANRIVELPSQEYDMPSKIKVISRHRPYKAQVFDLSAFWDANYYKPSVMPSQLSDEMTKSTLEVIAKDYIKGTAKLRSRLTGEIMTMQLKDVSEDTPLGPELSLEDTFTYKIQNKIFGR